jgi:uncharacterized membrane protein
MLNIKNINAKVWFLLVISLLIITDLSIIFNLSILRETFSFLFFTLIPGMLILTIMRLDGLEFIKKALLWMGLSISLLMFGGIFLNSLYPYLNQPLSLSPVLLTFNLIIIFLALLSYFRNKENFDIRSIFNFKLDTKDKLVSPLLFPLIFPILAILGTFVMNISQNNVFLLSMLLLIPIYLIVVVILREKITPNTYPLAVWLISLSLLLMQGLTSSHIMGRDVNTEFYSYRLTANNFHWDLYQFYNAYNACISITILPTIYQVISAIGAEYVFKLYFGLIGSIIPLVVFTVPKKYLNDKYAFFAALLFSFQLFFVNLLGAVRQELAVFFFFLTIMALFSNEINDSSRKFFIVLFLIATLISHYSTAYISLILTFSILLYPFFKNLVLKRKLVFTNFGVLCISILFLLIWYFFVAKVQFAAGTKVIGATVTALSNNNTANGMNSTRGDTVLGVLGVVFKSLPNTISIIVHDLIFASILVGLASVLRKIRIFKDKFDEEFLLGVFISIGLLIIIVALPYISIAYEAARLFFQELIFLAPIFVIGVMTISKLIKKPKWDVFILLILLLSLFSCATYLQYHFLGDPYSASYDKNGTIRGEQYIYNSELVSVSWLNKYHFNNLTTYSDTRELSRFLLVDGNSIQNKNINLSYFSRNKTAEQGYIYLGYVNVNNNQVYNIFKDIKITRLSDYRNLFTGKSKIYDDGGSNIWW